MAHLLAKQGKVLTHGELLYYILTTATKEIFPGGRKWSLFKNSLSMRIATWSGEDTGSNINIQLKYKVNEFENFFVLDELTNMSDTA